ncbi:hypothetical protein ACFLZ1_00475 [Patescibacteria group bacterium]
MKQHPVPQHIASYQFRLIGQMTLKQFLELIGGLIAAWLFYSLKITGFVKWPLVLISGLSGFALAFLPIEERPLDQWIINFLKSIYSPTQYLYKKKNEVPAIFNKKSVPVRSVKSKKTATQLSKLNIKEYLDTFPTETVTKPIEKKEQEHFLRIAKILASVEENKKDRVISTPTDTYIQAPAVIKTKVRSLGPKKPIYVPQTNTIKVEKTTSTSKPIDSLETGIKPQVKSAPPLSPPILVESRFAQKLDPAIAAQFSTTLPIPQTPNVANLVVGMVLNDMEKIIPGALIEIIDSRGETVRALKSNKLGQFFSASPLKKGKYQVKVEHLDYDFDIMGLEVKGKIILPIKIKAKKRKNN